MVPRARACPCPPTPHACTALQTAAVVTLSKDTSVNDSNVMVVKGSEAPVATAAVMQDTGVAGLFDDIQANFPRLRDSEVAGRACWRGAPRAQPRSWVGGGGCARTCGLPCEPAHALHVARCAPPPSAPRSASRLQSATPR